jgi:hypothetical protein
LTLTQPDAHIIGMMATDRGNVPTSTQVDRSDHAHGAALVFLVLFWCAAIAFVAAYSVPAILGLLDAGGRSSPAVLLWTGWTGWTVECFFAALALGGLPIWAVPLCVFTWAAVPAHARRTIPVVALVSLCSPLLLYIPRLIDHRASLLVVAAIPLLVAAEGLRVSVRATINVARQWGAAEDQRLA